MASSRGTRAEKVRRIFDRFDANGDGGLNREEMTALVVAVNPRVKFSDEQIGAILDEVFRTYADFIHPDRGLTLDGLLRTYDDGAGDVDRDFDALDLHLPGETEAATASTSVAATASSSIVDDPILSVPKAAVPRAAAPPWATSPNHGIAYDSSWALLDDLEILVKRLRSKHLKKSASTTGDNSSGNNNLPHPPHRPSFFHVPTGVRRKKYVRVVTSINKIYTTQRSQQSRNPLLLPGEERKKEKEEPKRHLWEKMRRRGRGGAGEEALEIGVPSPIGRHSFFFIIILKFCCPFPLFYSLSPF